MTSEFERIKRDVNGRSVMITSWFDAKQNGWRASAPNYSNIENLSPIAQREHFGTRQAAINDVIHVLVRHFDQQPLAKGDRTIFL